jgi:hypothetical protein
VKQNILYGSRFKAHRFECVTYCNAAGVFTVSCVYHPKDIEANMTQLWEARPISMLNVSSPQKKHSKNVDTYKGPTIQNAKIKKLSLV